MIRPLLLLAALAWPQPAAAQDLASLPDGAELSAEIVESRDTRALAEQLVARLARRPRPAPAGAMLDLPMAAVGPVSVHIYFPRSYLRSILARGYLNQHQTGRSIGRLDSRERMRVEDAMIGLRLGGSQPGPLGDKLRELRPKYGLVDFTAPQGVVVDPYGDAAQYGDVVLVLSGDVLKRVTTTPGDSLEEGHDALPLLGDRLRVGPLNRYIEAQVWGPIEVSDIAEVLVPEDLEDGLLDALRQARVPAYTYRQAGAGGYYGRRVKARPAGRGAPLTAGVLFERLRDDPRPVFGP